MARAALGLSQVDLAGLAHITTPTVNAAESDGSVLASTVRNIERALEAKGAIFGADGSVRIGELMAEFLEDPDRPLDPKARAFLARTLNIDRRRRGLPLFPEDET